MTGSHEYRIPGSGTGLKLTSPVRLTGGRGKRGRTCAQKRRASPPHWHEWRSIGEYERAQPRLYRRRESRLVSTEWA